MRKLFNLFAAALVMLAAVSCEKNEVLPDNNSEGKVVTLKASINNSGTKTSLGPGVQEGSNTIQYPVYWSENDAIAVIQQEDQQDGSVYIFTLSEGGAGKASATFECNNAYGFDPNLPYRAVYPASSVLTSNGKFCGYSFSATQSYVQNSFGVGAMPMQTNMYIGTNNPLNFSNVFGVLKLQLKGAADEKVTSIVVTSNDPLSGEAGLSGGKVVLKATAAKKVTLDCSANGGVALNQGTATDFHIALPAGVHELSVCFVTNKGVYYKTTAQTIESGRIIKMASLNTERKGEPGSDFPNGNMSYVENGVYIGEGVAISDGNSTIIWAPKNCGYNLISYPNGKVYQWGRKYGQSNGASINLVPIAPNDYFADEERYANTLFLMKSNPPGDWLDYAAGEDNYPELWKNSEKTSNDPCPEGWRVPTADELRVLSNNNKKKLSDGYKFTGNKHIDSYDGLFLPMAGWFKAWTDDRGFASGTCAYWSSSSYLTSNKRMAYYLSISEHSATVSTQLRAHGFYVRCVKL